MRRRLPEISYAEAAELSYFGAKVIHPKTISLPLNAIRRFAFLTRSIPRILGHALCAPRADGHTAKAVTTIRGLAQITVEGSGMQGVPGVAGRVFSAVAREGINALMISQSSSEQNICFVIESAIQRNARWKCSERI